MGALDWPSRLVENLWFVALTAASRFGFGRPSLGFVQGPWRGPNPPAGEGPQGPEKGGPRAPAATALGVVLACARATCMFFAGFSFNKRSQLSKWGAADFYIVKLARAKIDDNKQCHHGRPTSANPFEEVRTTLFLG